MQKHFCDPCGISKRSTNWVPSFATSNYFLREMARWEEIWLKGQTNTYLEGLNESEDLEGVKNLEKHLRKCRELRGDYVERSTVFCVSFKK